MPVTHGADVQSLVPLLVTLAKELFHDALNPVLVDGQGLGWVGEVCTVNHVLEDLFRIDRKKINIDACHTICSDIVPGSYQCSCPGARLLSQPLSWFPPWFSNLPEGSCAWTCLLPGPAQKIKCRYFSAIM